MNKFEKFMLIWILINTTRLVFRLFDDFAGISVESIVVTLVLTILILVIYEIIKNIKEKRGSN